MVRSILTSLVGLLLVGCGDIHLRRPVDLPVTTYPANQDFTMTLEMARCREACHTYGDASCDVNVKDDDRVIEVTAEVEVEVTDGELCDGDCSGGPVFAHCAVSSLPAGQWTVVSTEGNFERGIELVSP